MTTNLTDQIPDDYTYDDSCCADAYLAAITGIRMLERKSGIHGVRLDVELAVVPCDGDANEPTRTESYTDLTLDEAERLAWEILAAVEQLRTKEA